MSVVEQPDLGQVPPAQQQLDPHVDVGHVGDADHQLEPGMGGRQAGHGPQHGPRVDQVLDHVEGQDRRQRAVADDAVQGGGECVLVAGEVEDVALEAPLSQGRDRVRVDVGTHVVGSQVPHRLGQRPRRAAQVQHQALAHPGPHEQPVAVAVRALLAELPRVLLHALPPSQLDRTGTGRCPRTPRPSPRGGRRCRPSPGRRAGGAARRQRRCGSGRRPGRRPFGGNVARSGRGGGSSRPRGLSNATTGTPHAISSRGR